MDRFDYICLVLVVCGCVKHIYIYIIYIYIYMICVYFYMYYYIITWCIFMHLHASSCIFMHLHASSCIFMHLHAILHLPPTLLLIGFRLLHTFQYRLALSQTNAGSAAPLWSSSITLALEWVASKCSQRCPGPRNIKYRNNFLI